MTDKSQISIRALSIKPSLTLEISAKAKALKAEGKNICSLSAGEPDFDTPEFIIDAALKALAFALISRVREGFIERALIDICDLSVIFEA